MLSACQQRERLLREGTSKLSAAEAYPLISKLKLWIEFYGHCPEHTIKNWIKREYDIIKKVAPRSWEQKLNELIA